MSQEMKCSRCPLLFRLLVLTVIAFPWTNAAAPDQLDTVPRPSGLLTIPSGSQHSLLPQSPEHQKLLQNIVEQGLNESLYVFSVLEPKLFRSGQIVTRGDPAAGVAAFNYQDAKAKDLSRYAVATLKATALLRKKLSLNRQQIGSLSRVSLRNTPLFDECPLKASTIECPAFSRLYRTADGSCNNLEHPEWGASFRPFQRFLPAEYGDGVESFRTSVAGGPLPPPRVISALVHRNLNVSASQFTTMVMQWGQFLDHDVTSTPQTRGFNGSIPKCCVGDGYGSVPEDQRHPQCAPIEVPANDYFYSKHNITCMQFIRTTPTPNEDCTLGPREQPNQITSFIDASNVYGSTEEQLKELRLFKTGKLRYKDMIFRKSLLPALHHPLEGECRSSSSNMHCFHGGDIRVNEQPGLAAMHTVWLREHNRVSSKLAQLNPHWNDERLFHEARKIVVAEMQHISYNEWLPLVLGERVMEVFDLKLKRRGFFFGYNETVNPTSANAFGTAAFRFGHSLVPDHLNRCDRYHNQIPMGVVLRKELMDPTPVHNIGAVDRLVLGLCSQPAMRRDEFIVEELTNHLFQTTDKPFGMDLISINIQRGRDHGLPAYTVWREACGLTPIHNWGQLLSIMDDDTVGRLRIAYKYVHDIDLFPGAMAEKPVIGGIVGPTFACILAQQFLNYRHGDRFWYELGGQPSSFTESQLREIRRATLSRVICDNLDDVETIQPWIMLMPDQRTNPRMSCRGGTIPSVDLRAWKENEVKPTSFHGPLPGSILQKPGSSYFQDLETTDEEVEARSMMPLPEPEDDWIEELPRPLINNKDEEVPSSQSVGSKEGNFNGTRDNAHSNKLFYADEEKKQ